MERGEVLSCGLAGLHDLKGGKPIRGKRRQSVNLVKGGRWFKEYF